MESYINKEVLNSKTSLVTGSIVVIDGVTDWEHDGKLRRISFVEVGDRQQKVRLSRCEEDTLEEYIIRIKKMRDVLSKYISHLEVTK